MFPKIVVDFRPKPPTGHHLGSIGDEIEILCLQLLKSTTIKGKYGYYHLNKFQTIDGDIVNLNSSDPIPEGVEWWSFKGWVRDHTVWDDQRETFVGNPRDLTNRWHHAKLRQLRTCSYCGLPLYNVRPPFVCACVEIGEVEFWPEPIDIEIEEPETA